MKKGQPAKRGNAGRAVVETIRKKTVDKAIYAATYKHKMHKMSTN